MTLRRLADGLLNIRRDFRESGQILLTFDDGPHPEVTPQVLDRLARYNAKAVFFIVGSRIHRSPEVLPRIIAAGHMLGNHTYEHRLERDPWFVPYVRDVVRCQRAIEQTAGQRPSLFRAPMGRKSLGALLTPRVLGLRHLVWSLDENDWRLRNEADARECGRKLAERSVPGDVILLHDDNPCVLYVLDVLLPALSANGFDLSHAVSRLKNATR
jgi:peptidoglycan/xylan/chitin deacetylase (PgdA/CDA1 family)